MIQDNTKIAQEAKKEPKTLKTNEKSRFLPDGGSPPAVVASLVLRLLGSQNFEEEGLVPHLEHAHDSPRWSGGSVV